MCCAEKEDALIYRTTMNKKEITEIVNTLNAELYSKGIKRHYIDEWFIGHSPVKNKLCYRRISFGIRAESQSNYQLIIRIYTRTKKVYRLANKIVEKLGYGIIERVISKRAVNLLSNKVGSSVSCKKRKQGTIGAFVLDTNGNEGFITAGHVLPESCTKGTIKAYSPSLKSVSLRKSRECGYVVETHPPVEKNITEIDIALAISNKTGNTNVITRGKYKNKKIEQPLSGYQPPRNSKLHKLGKNFKTKSGVYNGDGFNIPLDEYVFRHVMTIKSSNPEFCKGGDSGAIVFSEDKDTGKLIAIGTVVAEKRISTSRIFKHLNYTELCIIPIEKSLNALKVKLI